MQPFVTRKEAVSNNNHNAFSALKGANLALMQSIQLHKSHFPAASILQVPTRPYVSVGAAQPALNYLVGTPASSSPRRRTETPAAVHASSLIPCKPGFLLRLSLVCHKSMVRSGPSCRRWEACSSSPGPMQSWKMSEGSVPLKKKFL